MAQIESAPGAMEHPNDMGPPHWNFFGYLFETFIFD